MKEEIIRQVKDIVLQGEGNRHAETGWQFYDEPIVQFASADDPLFEEFKTVAGPQQLTPREAFELAYGPGSFTGGTVMSVVVPVSEEMRKSNRPQKEWPSREWVQLRSFGDSVFMKYFQESIKTIFTSMGYRAVVPVLEPWYQKSGTPGGPVSNWSERHIAYAAGLGTFSLNDGFITEKGIAIRLASVVTDCILEPDKRTAKNHMENCLHYSWGTCGACIKRCPVGAITEKGHDKITCWKYCYGEESQKLAQAQGGIAECGAGCGLCQTNVPCEFKRP